MFQKLGIIKSMVHPFNEYKLNENDAISQRKEKRIFLDS